MFTNVLWLPKQLFLWHYVLFVNCTHLRCDQAEIDRKIAAMHRRLFGRD